jgi:hypothetical protein
VNVSTSMFAHFPPSQHTLADFDNKSTLLRAEIKKLRLAPAVVATIVQSLYLSIQLFLSRNHSSSSSSVIGVPTATTIYGHLPLPGELELELEHQHDHEHTYLYLLCQAIIVQLPFVCCHDQVS